MRVLKNVYNEFLVYMYRLNNTDLNWNKMLAIIVYKNIFPRDFCNLQLGNSFIRDILYMLKKNTWIFDYYKKSDDEGYVVVKNPIKDKRY